MAPCKHETLEYIGEQKTDEGSNSYRRCKRCGMLLVLTPTGKIIGIPGVISSQPDDSSEERSS